MSHQAVIILIGFAFLLFIPIYDYWAWLTTGTSEKTVSHLMTEWIDQWKIIAFLICLPLGHLFRDPLALTLAMLGLFTGYVFWR